MRKSSSLVILILAVLLLWLPASMTIAAKGKVKDRTRPVISSFSVEPELSDGKENISFKFRISETAKVSLGIYKDSKYVKTGLSNVTKKAGYVTWTWSGTKGNGNYTVKVDAVDLAGNKATQKVDTFKVDSVKPVISGFEADKTLLKAGSVNFSYNLSENARVVVKAVGGSLLTTGTTIVNANGLIGDNDFTWDTNALADGQYTISITATDEAGNSSASQTVVITKDGTAPTVSSYSFANSSFNPESGANNLTYQANEEVKATLVINDKGNNQVRSIENSSYAQSGNISWDGKDNANVTLTEGIYTYTLKLTDKAGNSKEVSGTVTITNGAPVIIASSITAPFAVTGSNSVSISYSLSEVANVDIKIYQGANLIKEIFNGAGVKGVNTATWDGKSANGTLVTPGTYTFKINAKDSVDNAAVEVSGTINVIDGTPPPPPPPAPTDNTAPVISGVTDGQITKNNVTPTSADTDIALTLLL